MEWSVDHRHGTHQLMEGRHFNMNAARICLEGTASLIDLVGVRLWLGRCGAEESRLDAGHLLKKHFLVRRVVAGRKSGNAGGEHYEDEGGSHWIPEEGGRACNEQEDCIWIQVQSSGAIFRCNLQVQSSKPR